MRRKVLIGLICGICALAILPLIKPHPMDDIRPNPGVTEGVKTTQPSLQIALAQQGVELGAPTFIRIFKEEALLEVWMQQNDRFVPIKTYDICNYSGHLGPKLQEGDRQSPEGFYNVDLAALNPNSSYHLSFNLGFPNQYDQSHDRTGSYLMVHGDCVSIGCYAMTDAGIEEIYTAVEAALRAGQADVPVHAFPFRMDDDRMKQAHGHRWYGFWENLKRGYDYFETHNIPPQVGVLDGAYTFL